MLNAMYGRCALASGQPGPPPDIGIPGDPYLVVPLPRTDDGAPYVPITTFACWAGLSAT